MKCLILDGSIGPIKERVAMAMTRTDVDAVLITTSPSEFKDGEIIYVNSTHDHPPTVAQMLEDFNRQQMVFMPAPKNDNAFPGTGKAADPSKGYKDGEEEMQTLTHQLGFGGPMKFDKSRLSDKLMFLDMTDLPAEDKVNGHERRGNDGC